VPELPYDVVRIITTAIGGLVATAMWLSRAAAERQRFTFGEFWGNAGLAFGVGCIVAVVIHRWIEEDPLVIWACCMGSGYLGHKVVADLLMRQIHRRMPGGPNHDPP
jgi:hypothetical protein